MEEIEIPKEAIEIYSRDATYYFEVDVSKLPSEIKKVRFVNSYWGKRNPMSDIQKELVVPIIEVYDIELKTMVAVKFTLDHFLSQVESVKEREEIASRVTNWLVSRYSSD